MKYQHVRTKGLECDFVGTEKKGKQIVYVALIGQLKFRCNKEIFEKEWKKTNRSENPDTKN